MTTMGERYDWLFYELTGEFQKLYFKLIVNYNRKLLSIIKVWISVSCLNLKLFSGAAKVICEKSQWCSFLRIVCHVRWIFPFLSLLQTLLEKHKKPVFAKKKKRCMRCVSRIILVAVVVSRDRFFALHLVSR